MLLNVLLMDVTRANFLVDYLVDVHDDNLYSNQLEDQIEPIFIRIQPQDAYVGFVGHMEGLNFSSVNECFNSTGCLEAVEFTASLKDIQRVFNTLFYLQVTN